MAGQLLSKLQTGMKTIEGTNNFVNFRGLDFTKDFQISIITNKLTNKIACIMTISEKGNLEGYPFDDRFLYDNKYF